MGEQTNGGIDLVQEPHRIDEISELKSLPGMRPILLTLNAPDSEFITLVSDAKLFANRSALFANDAESAMIACSLL